MDLLRIAQDCPVQVHLLLTKTLSRLENYHWKRTIVMLKDISFDIQAANSQNTLNKNHRNYAAFGNYIPKMGTD